jgi:hypothetical protein
MNQRRSDSPVFGSFAVLFCWQLKQFCIAWPLGVFWKSASLQTMSLLDVVVTLPQAAAHCCDGTARMAVPGVVKRARRPEKKSKEGRMIVHGYKKVMI